MTAKADCGCGCGDGGSVMTAALAPAGAGAVPEQLAGGLVRPRFFTGQLLATEDLQQLIEWVAAKDRLHKRLLVGDGVVCGLQVGCHPCGDGHVLVRPGYAVDCCGNDLLLPCEQDLDVNAMVRDLLTEMRGVDCGDPCAPASGKGSAKGGEGEPPTYRYALYVRHVETLTDPLAPYATDEPCDADGCEPSRIREGVRFELRCAEERKEPDDIVARIIGCLGDLLDVDRRGKRHAIVSSLADAAPAIARFRAVAAPQVVAEDAETLQQALDGLRKIGEAPGEPDADAVRAALDRLRAATGVAARLRALGDAERKAALKDVPGLDAAVKRAPAVVEAAVKRIEPALEKAVPDELERSAARALIAEAPRFLGSELTDEQRKEIETYLAQHGVVVDAELLRLLREDQAKLREWLLSRLRKAQLTTDCGLLAFVEAIDVSDPGGDEGDDILRTLGSRLELEQALRRYAAQCVCMALLPPCPDCDDPSVPLAVIEVRECDVVHVCNLERRIAVTGTALSYWIPMERLGALLDHVCCELPREPVEPRRGKGFEPVRDVPVFRRAEASTDLGRQVLTLAQGTGLATPEARGLSRITDNVAAIVGDDELVTPATAPLRAQIAKQDGQLNSLRMQIGQLRKQSSELEKQLEAIGKKP